MGSLVCEKCGKTFTFDVVPRRGAICFGCHVKNVNIGFTHGQEVFHGATFKEREREIIGDAIAEGRDIEYVGNK